jgi:hypothetical protein
MPKALLEKFALTNFLAESQNPLVTSRRLSAQKEQILLQGNFFVFSRQMSNYLLNTISLLL